jgi:hypothetical protein
MNSTPLALCTQKTVSFDSNKTMPANLPEGHRNFKLACAEGAGFPSNIWREIRVVTNTDFKQAVKISGHPGNFPKNPNNQKLYVYWGQDYFNKIDEESQKAGQILVFGNIDKFKNDPNFEETLKAGIKQAELLNAQNLNGPRIGVILDSVGNVYLGYPDNSKRVYYTKNDNIYVLNANEQLPDFLKPSDLIPDRPIKVTNQVVYINNRVVFIPPATQGYTKPNTGSRGGCATTPST